MSLIITSNESREGGLPSITSGTSRPYDYTNHFSQSLEIPANSEIAVQSVKINRSGTISINQANTKFYMWLNKYNQSTTPPMSQQGRNYDTNEQWSTGICMPTQIGTNKNNEYDEEGLSQAIQFAVQQGLFHPNLQKSTMNSSGVVVSTKYTDDKFEGFSYAIHQSRSASNVDLLTSLNFEDALAPAGYAGAWDSAARTITKTADYFCEMIGTKYPISQVDGEFKFSFKDAGAGWSVGLTRYLNIKAQRNLQQNPNYSTDREQSFFDWRAESVEDDNEDYYLRLYHQVVDEDGDEDEISEIEFDYWTPHVSLTGPIEIYTLNASYGVNKVSELTWSIKNERVIVKVQSSDETILQYTLCDGTNANKLYNMKPTNSVTKMLYPKVWVRDNANFITIQKFEGVAITGFTYGDKRDVGALNNRGEPQTALNMDLWARLYWTAEQSIAQECDTRYMMDPADITGGSGANGSYTQSGLNASGGLDAVPVTILRDTAHHFYNYPKIKGASAGNLLGFFRKNPAQIWDVTDNYKWGDDSKTIPQMTSSNSIFVRLNNFTQTSFNCMTGSPSKMLYHIPRFDNAGTEFGGLFFEVHEKTFVALNNTSPMVINDLSVSLVNINETLASNLIGKTIVCFVIREKK